MKVILASFVFCFLFFSLLPHLGQAATLYLMPQSQTVYQGDGFLVEIKLDTEGEEINTAQVGLTFPQNLLEAIDFSKGNSILQLFAEEPKIQKGEISFTGGIPKGFNGNGLLAKITFLAREIGRARVNFKENSQVLLNDPEGKKARLNFLEGNYKVVLRPIELPVLSSPSNPDQNKWYSADSFEIHWKGKPGAEYSYLLSRDPLMEPDESPEELINDLKWEKMEDGIYYFQLIERVPGEAWSDKVTYRFMIDTTPPEPFEPQIGQDPKVFEGKYFLSFATVDKMSGIDYYQVLEADRGGYQFGTKKKAEWKIAKSPYLLEDQSLRSVIKVKAIDKAGNERIAEILPPPPKLTWKDIIIPLLILIGIGIIWWLIRKRKKQRLGFRSV